MASIRMTTKFAQPHVCQVCRMLHAAHRTSASSSRRRNLSRRGTRLGFRSRPRGHARVRSRGRARSCGVLRHVHQRPFLWVNHEDVQIAILWIFHPMETQFILCCSGRRAGRRPCARPRGCPLDNLSVDLLGFLAVVVIVFLPVIVSVLRMCRSPLAVAHAMS